MCAQGMSCEAVQRCWKPATVLSGTLTAQLHDQTNQQSQKGILFARWKFWQIVLPVAITTLTGLINTISPNVLTSLLVYYTAKSTSSGGSDPSPPLPPGLTQKQIEQIHKVVDEWIKEKKETDELLWDSVTLYIDTWPDTSIQAQSQFMSYIKMLSTDVPWKWTSVDLEQKVEDLVNAYTSAKRYSDIYRKVKGMMYQQPDTSSLIRLPRFQAADLCDRALSDINDRSHL